MEAGWVVTIAVASFVVGSGLGWLGGWWRLRRTERARQAEREAERAAHERRVAGLRAELVAAAAARSLAGRASGSQVAASPAPAETDRPSVAEIEAELRAAESELQALRERQAILEPVIDEVEVTRRYIETLQRELVYRDEQLIELQTGPRLDLTRAPGPDADAGSTRELGRDRVEQPAVEELLERDPGNL